MKSLITAIFTFLSLSATAQGYYWVGGSGNWSDYANHWATSSDGSIFHSTAPSILDNVVFDANSFSASNQVVILDVEANCNAMDWSGVAHFPTIDGNGNVMNIHGSLNLASDMTADFSDIEFESSTNGNTITTHGASIGISATVIFNGIGGEWSLMDDLEAFKLIFNAGTIHTNNNNLNISNRIDVRGSDVKTFNLGSSHITTGIWFSISATNFNINPGTSKIIITGSLFGNSAEPSTYYDVEFPLSVSVNRRLSGTASFNVVTVQSGVNLELKSGDTFIIYDLKADGSKHDLVSLFSSSSGSEATLSKPSGNVTTSFIELQDIHTSGNATFAANSATDHGNNTGWTISAIASQDYYWVGNTGDWSDFVTHWATTSGGSTMHNDYPGSSDNVYFDANSFDLDDQQVELDIDATCFDMDWTGVTYSPRFSAPAKSMQIFGSVVFSNEVTKAASIIMMSGKSSHTITYGNSGGVGNFRIDGTGTFTLMDSLYANVTIAVKKGTLNLNDQSLKAISVEVVEATLNMGSSNIYTNSFKIFNTLPVTIDQGTSTLFLQGDLTISNTPKSFSLHNLVIDGTSSIEGANTFENLEIKPGSNVSFEEATTTTVNGNLILEGTKAAPITLNSSSTGIQAAISMPGGSVDAIYLILQDMNATGATYQAAQTIDNGNNTGWDITGILGENYYWVGNSGDWSDFGNHWAQTSGGTTFHTTVPGVLDNVFFDNNSFSSSGQTVTIDLDEANSNDFDASLSTDEFTIAGSSKQLNIYGSISLSGTVNSDVTTYNFLSNESETLDFNDGPGNDHVFNFLSSGSWTLMSGLVLRELSLEQGNLVTNDQRVNIDGSIKFSATNTKSLSLGSSIFYARTWNAGLTENLTIDGGTAETSFAGSLDFNISPTANNNVSFHNMILVDGASSSMFGEFYMNKFTLEAGSTLTFFGNAIINTNEFVAVGTLIDLITIQPNNEQASLTINQSSGVVDAYFIEMEKVTAAGGATFNAFNSSDNGNVIGWLFQRNSQTIVFDDLENKVLGDAPFGLSAVASSGLDVILSIVSGPATLLGNVLTMTGVGEVTIRAEQLGNIDYDPAPSVSKSFFIAELAQVITFAPLTPVVFGDPDFTLIASTDSELTIDYTSSDETVATVLENTVTIIGAGTTNITASQVGNETYGFASNQQSLVVNKAAQTINFTTIGDQTLQDSPITLQASTTSGLNVEFVLLEGDGVITDNQLMLNDVGAFKVIASQTGNKNYLASTADQEFEVATDFVEVTGLGDESFQKIEIYPVPFREEFLMQLPDCVSSTCQLIIINASGVVVVKRMLSNSSLSIHRIDDLKSAPRGVYLLQFRMENRYSIYRIVKL